RLRYPGSHGASVTRSHQRIEADDFAEGKALDTDGVSRSNRFTSSGVDSARRVSSWLSRRCLTVPSGSFSRLHAKARSVSLLPANRVQYVVVSESGYLTEQKHTLQLVRYRGLCSLVRKPQSRFGRVAQRLCTPKFSSTHR